jgi:glycosyltransferase involved in cell wall biosynthesis
MEEKPYLSIVVPIYNEEGNVKQFHQEIKATIQKI